MIGSNYSIIQLLTFSGIALLLFAISLLLGLLFYNIKLNNTIKTYFLNSFLGIFTIVCLYSYTIVGFKTINLLSGIVLAYLCFKNNSRFKFDKLNVKELAHILYIFPIVFILYGCYTLPLSIEYDVRYYSKIAYSFREFKQENFYHFYNQYNGFFYGTTPYHYFEMWLTSLITLPFSIKSIIALKYITYPFFISSISFGVLGLIKSNKFFWFLIFICLSMLPLYVISIFGSGFPVYTDFWIRPNFVSYYYILLPIFYFIIERKWVYLYLTVIIGCTVSVMIIPCLFGGVFLLSVVLVYKKAVMKKEFFSLNLLLLTTCLFIFSLFILFSPVINLVVNHPFKELLFQSLAIWKAVLHSIVTISIECSVLIIVAFLIGKYVIKTDKLKNVIFFVLVQVILGVVLFQTLNKLDNSYQFPYFAYSASGFLFIISILLFLDYFQNKLAKLSMAGLIVITNLYTSYSSFNFLSLITNSLEERNLAQNSVSNDWIKNVTNYLNNNKKSKGGFVLSKVDLKDLGPKSRSCITLQSGSFISYLTDNCNLPNLTCKDTLLSDKNDENKEAFEKVEKWMEAFPMYTNECDINEYISNSKIDYFICSKNVLNIDTSLVNIISDKKSKYLFVSKK